jgi:hypothetical protein
MANRREVLMATPNSRWLAGGLVGALAIAVLALPSAAEARTVARCSAVGPFAFCSDDGRARGAKKFIFRTNKVARVSYSLFCQRGFNFRSRTGSFRGRRKRVRAPLRRARCDVSISASRNRRGRLRARAIARG